MRPLPRVLTGCLLIVALACAAADAPQRYTQGPASFDGIGKVHEGREIAHVMGWQAAPWLERDEREREEGSALLLAELALRPGLVVADIGAGSGWYSRRIAPLLGGRGRVYAVDIQPEMLELLRALPQQPGAAPIEPVLGAVDAVNLPAASVDLAIMVDVYHELEYPWEMLESLIASVKPGGRIALVEYRGEDRRVPIKALHKMTERQVRREAEAHGLRWLRTARTLPWQHVVLFERTRLP
jgi:predicted methyltransferase